MAPRESAQCYKTIFLRKSRNSIFRQNKILVKLLRKSREIMKMAILLLYCFSLNWSEIYHYNYDNLSFFEKNIIWWLVLAVKTLDLDKLQPVLVCGLYYVCPLVGFIVVQHDDAICSFHLVPERRKKTIGSVQGLNTVHYSSAYWHNNLSLFV